MRSASIFSALALFFGSAPLPALSLPPSAPVAADVFFFASDAAAEVAAVELAAAAVALEEPELDPELERAIFAGGPEALLPPEATGRFEDLVLFVVVDEEDEDLSLLSEDEALAPEPLPLEPPALVFAFVEDAEVEEELEEETEDEEGAGAAGVGGGGGRTRGPE